MLAGELVQIRFALDLVVSLGSRGGIWPPDMLDFFNSTTSDDVIDVLVSDGDLYLKIGLPRAASDTYQNTSLWIWFWIFLSVEQGYGRREKNILNHCTKFQLSRVENKVSNMLTPYEQFGCGTLCTTQVGRTDGSML